MDADQPNMNIRLIDYQFENSMLILSARNHALLSQILKEVVGIKAKMTDGNEKELFRVAELEMRQEILKAFDLLPKKSV